MRTAHHFQLQVYIVGGMSGIQCSAFHEECEHLWYMIALVDKRGTGAEQRVSRMCFCAWPQLCSAERMSQRKLPLQENILGSLISHCLHPLGALQCELPRD